MANLLDEAGTAILDEAGGFIADELGPDVAVVQQQGGWWQLYSILQYARQEFDFYAERPPMACPRDGEPLRNAPPADSGSSTELYCTFCTFEYPRDWIRPAPA